MRTPKNITLLHTVDGWPTATVHYISNPPE